MTKIEFIGGPRDGDVRMLARLAPEFEVPMPQTFPMVAIQADGLMPDLRRGIYRLCKNVVKGKLSALRVTFHLDDMSVEVEEAYDEDRNVPVYVWQGEK